MKPIFKWTGGKRKEISIFSEYYPEFVKNKTNFKFVEPFFGGGAVYWNLESNNNIINDIEFDIMNFLTQLRDNATYIKNEIKNISKEISKITELEKDKLISIAEAKEQRGKFYYEWRNKDRNDGINNLTNKERAVRFFIVNQLAFNGMRRFNRKGEFNIPYGNYKQLNLNFTPEHINKLKNTEINYGTYKDIMFLHDTDDTFIYLDPPYTREFKEYNHNNIFGKKQQIELSDTFKSMKNAKVMLIINKDDFIVNLYKDYIKHEYDLKYSTNIKNRYDNTVKHLIICNY